MNVSRYIQNAKSENSLLWDACFVSPVPRPLQDFIYKLKISRRPGTITISQTRNDGIGYYVMWNWFLNNGNVPTQLCGQYTVSDQTVKLA